MSIVVSRAKKIGNSLWVLIPKEVAEERKIKEGQTVRISLLAKEREQLIKETFGIAKGSKGYDRRDCWNREF